MASICLDAYKYVQKPLLSQSANTSLPNQNHITSVSSAIKMTISSLQFRSLAVPTASKVDFGQEVSNIDLEHLSGKSHLIRVMYRDIDA